MPIEGIIQPEQIKIGKKLRLRKYDGVYDFAYDWYQDKEMTYLVDGVGDAYSWDRLKRMYEYLDTRGELYFIEFLQEDQYVPIGDVTFWKDDMPIVIGDPLFRGKGIGYGVVTALIRRAMDLGYTTLHIDEIYDFNEGSKRCFEKAGFKAYEKTEKGSRYVLEVPDYSKVCLETKDLWIKKAKQEDWKAMYENLWSHAESAKYMLWNVTTSEEDAKSRMIRTIELEQTEKYLLLVYEKVSGQAIGFAGMSEIEPGVYGENGIAIGPDFTGKGYGKQILNALVEEAFSIDGIEKFRAGYRTKNIASKMLQKSCGFTYVYSEEHVDPRNGEDYVIAYGERKKEA